MEFLEGTRAQVPDLEGTGGSSAPGLPWAVDQLRDAG